MLRLQVFKPLDRRTASVEVWNEDILVAEVFASEGGERRLYVSEAGARLGLDWAIFEALAPKISALLDEADDEMRETRKLLGEE